MVVTTFKEALRSISGALSGLASPRSSPFPSGRQFPKVPDWLGIVDTSFSLVRKALLPESLRCTIICLHVCLQCSNSLAASAVVNHAPVEHRRRTVRCGLRFVGDLAPLV